MKKYTKDDAVKIITSCARKYNEELEGKSLLFICTDKHKRAFSVEVSFNSSNYLHLTGLKVRKKQTANTTDDGVLSAERFYRKCMEHKLSPADFDFSEDGTTHLKLAVLPYIISKNLCASMVGDFSATNPKLYTEKLVGGTKACVGFVIDSITGKYVPNTVIKEDIRNVTKNALRIILVYRKTMSDPQYEELTYAAKKVDWSAVVLPDDLSYLPLPTKN
jgi:hypothetical protein